MKKLLVVALCLMSTTSLSVQAGPATGRDHKIAGKIATHLSSKENGGGVPTENGTWSWHSDFMEKLCESVSSPFGDVACDYWTGHSERQKK